jgi:hypothetical protein
MHGWLSLVVFVGQNLANYAVFTLAATVFSKQSVPDTIYFFLRCAHLMIFFTKQQSVIGPVATLMFQRPPQPSVLRHNMPAWLRWRVLALWNDDSASALFA